MAALRGERPWRIPVDGTSVGAPTAYSSNDYERLRTVVSLPDRNSPWLRTTNADNNGDGGESSDKVFRTDLQ
ncbi:hypothetical protein T261_0183 [Streptomyces lydicus]|nr:hypothetical protein T261_0183 [Streptomyces lydicus]